MSIAWCPPEVSRSITPAGSARRTTTSCPKRYWVRFFVASSSRPSGRPSRMGSCASRKLEAPLRTQDLRCLAPATVSTRLGRLLETSLRWPPICAAISRPLHPPRGYLQSSLGLICGWPGHLSLARFGPQQRTETHDSIARQVLTPLPAAYSSARFCAYPALRFPGLPTALHNIAPMLPVVGCGTRSA